MDFERRERSRNNSVICCCNKSTCTGNKTFRDGDNSHMQASPVTILSLPSPSPSRTKTYFLELRDLSYQIVTKKKKGPMNEEISPFNAKSSHSQYILKHVTCDAKPGELLAVAGPSGAGKSTLLEVLGGKIPPSSPSTSILVNGHPMDRQHFRRISGYVMQDDALFPMLTVRETLLYSARLRIPSAVPMTEKNCKG